MIKQLALCTLIASTTLVAPYACAADQSGSKLDAAFKKADPDHDGTLTRDEAKAMPRVAKHFDAIDTDKASKCYFWICSQTQHLHRQGIFLC